MRSWLARVATVCLPMLLGGCLAFGDVDRRATEFDQGVGTFQNRAILLNLARASLREPMYFVSVGPANAQGLEDFRASLPSFEEGPHLTPALHLPLVTDKTGGGRSSRRISILAHDASCRRS